MYDSQIRILIAEDSTVQAEALRRILAAEGYAVTIAKDGAEGLSKAREFKPDLVISDIMMPGMNGFELCRHIKNDADLKNIPVILLTSLSDPADVISGLECGADNFIIKPYEEKHLVSRIRYMLLSREFENDERTQMGVEIHFADRKCFITSEKKQILDLLISTYESAVQKNLQLARVQETLQGLNEKLEKKVSEKTASLTSEIAERKIAQEIARMVNQQNEAILNSAGEGIIGLDREGKHTFVNPAAAKMLGYCFEEFIGRSAHEMWHHTTADGSPCAVEKCLIYATLKNGTENIQQKDVLWRKDGTSFPVEYTSTPLFIEGKLEGSVFIFNDISELTQLKEALEKLSVTDELTGLYNRRGFFASTRRELQLARRRRDKMTLIYADLDGMKWINDTFGHHEGDNALLDMTDILRRTFRASDILARMGGDEFVVFAVDTCEEEIIRRRLRENINKHNSNAEIKYKLSLSIGVACSHESGDLSIEEMLAEADKKMYELKMTKIECRRHEEFAHEAKEVHKEVTVSAIQHENERCENTMSGFKSRKR